MSSKDMLTIEECAKCISLARNCQKLMEDRTAEFIREPTLKEALEDSKKHEKTLIVRKKQDEVAE